MLLTPSALEDSCRQETISRLDRFSSLTGGRDIVIAFLQSEEPLPEQGGRYSLHPLLDLQSMFVMRYPVWINAKKTNSHRFLLYASLLQHIAIPIPILTVPHVDALLLALRAHIKDLEKSTELSQTISPLSAMPTSLLSHATATAPHLPLSEHDTNVLSDLFPSFRTLSQAVTTPEGRDIVREYFDEETARNIIEFWRR